MKHLPSGKVQDYIYLGTDENGKEIRKYASANTPKQLERKLIELRRQYDRGERSVRDMLFREASTAWWATKVGIWRPGTTKFYARTRKQLDTEFGHLKVSRIRPITLRAFFAPMPPSVRAGVHQTARQIFQMLVNDEVLDRNPMSGIKHDYRQPERRHVTYHDLESLARAELPPLDRLFTYLMLYGGLRIGEVMGLRGIDLADGMIAVRRQVDRATRTYGPTKTKAGVRTIPIADQLAAVIPSVLSPLEPIFKYSDGRPASPSRANRHWKSSILPAWNRAAGGTDSIWAIQQYTPHELRHTCATLWALLPVLPDQLQCFLGHETVSISYNLYSHANKVRQERPLYEPYLHRYGGRTEVGPVQASASASGKHYK